MTDRFFASVLSSSDIGTRPMWTVVDVSGTVVLSGSVRMSSSSLARVASWSVSSTSANGSWTFGASGSASGSTGASSFLPPNLPRKPLSFSATRHECQSCGGGQAVKGGRTVEGELRDALAFEKQDGLGDGDDVRLAEADGHLDGRVGDRLGGQVRERSREPRDGRLKHLLRLLRRAAVGERRERAGSGAQGGQGDARLEGRLVVAELDREVSRLLERHRLGDAELGERGEEVRVDRARLGVCSSGSSALRGGGLKLRETNPQSACRPRTRRRYRRA